jgi:glycosyltransferase involved in cell wall biosynthesis
VLPSHIEGMPNALIEAMACGLPVISTPVGSVPDVVENGVNGMLVPVRDPASLCAAIAALLAAPAERERIGRAAHASALTQFGLDEAVARLTSAFKSVTISRAVS